VRDYAYAQWLETGGDKSPLPAAFVTAEALPAQAHLAMQAHLQPYVDGAISKTINLPGTATVQDVDEIFLQAFSRGIKGCTVFRHGSVRGQVLLARNESHAARWFEPSPACTLSGASWFSCARIHSTMISL
jgi:ribonucleoside-diphosphate reductase alpha chain